MPTSLWAALIGGVCGLGGAALGFFGRLLIDGPATKGGLLVTELAYFAEQMPKLRMELDELRRQLAGERATHVVELAERDGVIVKLSVRVSELERSAMTPAQRAADSRRQQAILNEPDRPGGD